MSKRAKRAYRFWRVDAGGLAALAGVSVALWVLGVGPVLAREAARIERERQVREAAESVSRLNESHRSMTGQLEVTRRKIDESDVKLQPTHHLNALIAELTELAAATGLTVEQVQPGAVIEGTHYRTIPIELSGRGGYVDCARFLSLLHGEYRDTSVHALRLSGEPRRPGERAEFRFTIHWHASPTMADAR